MKFPLILLLWHLNYYPSCNSTTLTVNYNINLAYNLLLIIAIYHMKTQLILLLWHLTIIPPAI
jgi:hypothetical protein